MQNSINIRAKNRSKKKTIIPQAADKNMLEINYASLDDVCKKSGNTDFCDLLAEDENKKILDAIFGNSPFLSKCVLKELDFFQSILTNDINDVFDNLLKSTLEETEDEENINLLIKELRIFKRRIALLTGVADISQKWEVKEVTDALSKCAELSLNIAINHQIKEFTKKDEIEITNGHKGIIILAMGKLGANELNYSSDIDIIVLYDGNNVKYNGKHDIGHCFIKITRNIIKIMEEKTEDGYIFRTDLRIRPDPGSTPIAMSIGAAETYYESFGLNWERAAIIKATPIAGDIEEGHSFLRRIRPFVWRRTLDFQAIDDIHSIKEQLNHGNPADFFSKDIDAKDCIKQLLGYNIKTGQGGIREIEFFAQIQQLIWGGRDASLRKRSTCNALIALLKSGHIDRRTCFALIDSYEFLRTLEHRLQMVDDVQTHSLPKSEEQFKKISLFMGYESKETFASDIIKNLKLVNSHYQSLSYRENSYEARQSTLHLSFSGANINTEETDQETIEQLEEMDFSNPKQTATIINSWFYGRYKALRTTRAQNLMQTLIPQIIEALSKTSDPDHAFTRFDDFLKNQPAGVQLFAMFTAKPALLDLIAEIMGDAPSLASYLSKSTSLLGAIITPGFFDPIMSKRDLETELSDHLFHATSYENILDMCRIWVKEKKLKTGIQLFKNIISADHACKNISDIADVVLSELSRCTSNDFAYKHGIVNDVPSMAILALGKLGSREMSPSSDLDLIFIYDDEENEEKTPDNLPPSAYFSRLSQRLISAVSAPTAEGKLWEIDMRLRPSGNSGPLATSITAFKQYQEKEAWTWEHQALCKARVVCSSNKLNRKIERIIKDTLCKKRDSQTLLDDVTKMRQRMKKEHKPKSEWDVKNIDGGMIDIEFITQYLQLGANSKSKALPNIFAQNTQNALTNLADAKLIDLKNADQLKQAHKFFMSVQAIIRQTVENHNVENISDGLKQKIADATGCADVDETMEKMQSTAKKVSDIYNKIMQK